MLPGFSASDTRFTADKVEIAQAYSETSWPTCWCNFGWPCHLCCIQWEWRFDIGQHYIASVSAAVARWSEKKNARMPCCTNLLTEWSRQ